MRAIPPPPPETHRKWAFWPVLAFALVIWAGFCGFVARADFRVFQTGADAGIAQGIDCYNATCSRTGSLLTMTGGGGGQWVQVDGGLHHGAAVSIDAGLFARSLTTSGSLRAGSAWFNGAVAIDAGLTVIGNTGVQGNGVITGSLITGPSWHNGTLGVDAGVVILHTATNFPLQVTSVAAGQDGILSLHSSSATGFNTIRFNNSSDVTKMSFGYGGASTASPYTSSPYLFTSASETFKWINANNVHGTWAGSTGNLVWDTPTFAVDAANNRVGVGTVSPAVAFDVLNSTSGSAMKVRSSSTSAFSTIFFADSSDATAMSFGHGNSATSSPYTSRAYLFTAASKDFRFVNNGNVHGEWTSNGNLAWDTDVLYVDAANNRIGVNDATPSVALDVTGAISSSSTITGVTGTFTGALSGNGFTSGNAYINGSLGVDAGVTVAGALNVVGAIATNSTLACNGNATLGDASGDTLTIAGTAVSATNGLVITSAGAGIGVDIAAGGSGTIGLRGTGNGSSVGVRGVGGASGPGCSCAAGSTSGQGIVATASSGSASAGVLATGGGTNGRGVDGTGGGTSGVGVFGTGASTSGTGTHGQGGGSGSGVRGIGGATGIGGNFTGGATSGIGVVGTGTNVSAGVRGVGGSSGGRGGEFVGSANGDGLSVSVDTGSTGKAINMDSTNGTGYAFYAIADQSSPVSAVGRFATQDTDPSVAVNGDFYVYSGNESFRVYTRSAWRELQVLGKDSTDNSGSPGATTINKPNGRFAVAIAATSVVVTNSYVAAASQVMVTPMDLDATCTLYKVVPAAGSFTLTVNAACTAATKFMFSVE